MAGRPDALEATLNILERVKRGEGHFCPSCERDVVDGKRRLVEWLKAEKRGAQ